ncbi:MAG: hypothetical protein L6R39_007007 [Caloplaca ligustica]|nr:MAG: hypothetical protein L6R39_007007 [Caloplaca ligustica]
MGRVGIHGWDLRLTGQLKFPESHNFALNALSSTTPPQFQTKSVLWTLREAFEEYVDREQYSSAALTARLDGRPLGFATIKSTLAQGQAADSFTSSPSPFPHLGRRGLDVRLDYVPNGVSFTDVGLFRTMIHLLVWAANHDPKSVGSGKLGIYNNVEDYTFEMGPMDEESVDELVLVRVIQVLGTLPAAMYHEQRGGRWAELKGVIKFDGVNIGRIKLEKGQHVHCTHSNGTATS